MSRTRAGALPSNHPPRRLAPREASSPVIPSSNPLSNIFQAGNDEQDQINTYDDDRYPKNNNGAAPSLAPAINNAPPGYGTDDLTATNNAPTLRNTSATRSTTPNRPGDSIKRKTTPENSTTSGTDGSDENLPEIERKREQENQRSRARDKISATKARKRRSMAERELVAESNRKEHKYVVSKRDKEALLRSRDILMSLVLLHQYCDCTELQRFAAKVRRRWTNGTPNTISMPSIQQQALPEQALLPYNTVAAPPMATSTMGFFQEGPAPAMQFDNAQEHYYVPNTNQYAASMEFQPDAYMDAWAGGWMEAPDSQQGPENTGGSADDFSSQRSWSHDFE